MRKLIFSILILIPLFGTAQMNGILQSIASQQSTGGGDGGSGGVSGDTITLNTLKAFPSAFGAGADFRIDPSTATIYEVTNTNTSGSGSFRAAFEATGNRIIIIKVEGFVDDNSVYQISGSTAGNFAIWGQMAPGLGLTIDHPRMSTDRAGNLVYRHLTLQASNGLGCTVNTNCFDALNTYRVDPNSSVYLDHMSLRYSPDQTWTLNVDETENDIDLIKSTAAYILFAEADPAHSTGSIMNVWNSGGGGLAVDIGDHTFARNMFYDVSHRFPNLNANGDYENFNNYVTNYKARLSRYNVTPVVDWHRNYIESGNLTGQNDATNKLNQGSNWGGGEPSIFAGYNYIEGINTNVADNVQDDAYVWFDTEGATYYGVPVTEGGPVPVEFFSTTQQHSFNPPSDGYWDALDVKTKILASVGHNRGINPDGTPYYGRDDVDTDYIDKAGNNNTNTNYRATGSWNNTTYPSTSMYTDSDGDNMPDWFEDQFAFLDKNSSADMLTTSNVIWDFGNIGAAHDYVVINNAGYTNLEMCAEFYAGGFETMIDGTNNMNIGDN